MMKRWKYQLEGPLGDQRVSQTLISRGIRLSRFLEGPRASSVQVFTENQALEQSIQILPQKQYLRISFPNSVRRISTQAKEIWRSSDESHACNYQILLQDQPTTLCFELRNGSRIYIEHRNASLVSALLATPWMLSLLAILSIHVSIVEISKLEITTTRPIEAERIDVSKLDISLASFSSPSIAKPRAQEEMPKSLQNLLRGFGLKSKVVAAPRSERNASRPFPNLKTPEMDKLFDYGEDGPEIISKEEVVIDAEAIAAVLRPYQAELKECYDDALFVDGSMSGRAKILLSAAASGRLEAIEIAGLQGSAAARDSLTRCFHRVLGHVKLPPAATKFAVSQSLILYR